MSAIQELGVYGWPNITIADTMDTKYPTYQWEELGVFVEDRGDDSEGYRLRMHHIWSDEAQKLEKKGPIMFMHGEQSDSTIWLDEAGKSTCNSPDDAPMIQLANEGYDVYMPNNRGTRYGLGHSEDQWDYHYEDFWSFDLTTMARDISAAAKVMFLNAGTGKGWFVGYAEGATQGLMVSAQDEEEMAKYFHKLILVAPCFTDRGQSNDSVFNTATNAPGYVYENLASIDIWTTGGERWFQRGVQICSNLDEELCEWAEDQRDEFKANNATTPLTSTLMQDHWKQMAYTERFQLYNSDKLNFWELDDDLELDFDIDDYEAPLIPIENLSLIQVSMILPEKGLHCPRTEAWEYANLIPTIDNFSHISGVSHTGLAKESGTTYMELLRNELTEFVDETELDRTLD